MAKKKQKKQQAKKSGKKGKVLKEKGKVVKEKGKKRLDALEEERRQLQLQVAELQRRLDEAPEERSNPEPAVRQPETLTEEALPRKRPATGHKIDWERYSYLHDRYEVHVENGVDKVEARRLANEELMEKFGGDAGYTDEQLEAIFL